MPHAAFIVRDLLITRLAKLPGTPSWALHPAAIQDSTTLHGLGFDETDQSEILHEIEEEIGIGLRCASETGSPTVERIVDEIEALLASRAAATATPPTPTRTMNVIDALVVSRCPAWFDGDTQRAATERLVARSHEIAAEARR